MLFTLLFAVSAAASFYLGARYGKKAEAAAQAEAQAIKLSAEKTLAKFSTVAKAEVHKVGSAL